MNKPNNLLSLARNNNEIELLKAFLGKKPINQYNEQELPSVIDLVGYWMTNLGVMDTISVQEMQIVANFIIDEFGHLTADEIRKAISLSLKDALDCDTELYNKSFSARYVGKILSAFIKYKNAELKDYRTRMDAEQLKYDYVPATPEQKMQITITYIRDSYFEYMKDKSKVDYLHLCYGYLKKTDRIKASKQMIDDAMKFGELSLNSYMEKNFMNALKERLKGYDGVDKEQIKIKYAKSYLVAQFFNELDMDKFLESVSIQDFQ